MNNTGLYIHIPFCANKCNYCNFYSLIGRDSLIAPYFNALKDEIASYPKLNIDTIYFGGGTPTYVGVSNIVKLIDFTLEHHNVENCEITVECNPKTIDYQGFSELRAAGVNRISIGAQSADDNELKTLGRTHTFSDFLDCHAAAREAGFDNISVDIMFGLPGQSLHNFDGTLESVAALDVAHISAYMLKVEEGTPFYRSNLKLPDDDTVADMYDKMVEYLAEQGFERYEISNFAKPGYQSKHNLKYWKCRDYIGVGAAAHSCFDGKRYFNLENVKRYISGKGRARGTVLEPTPEEFIFLGLRLTEGVSAAEFAEKFKVNLYDYVGDKIRDLAEKGLLREERGRISIPPELMFVSNSIMCEFI
ncbi:MAG: radical SAM family heme chaperone HemW [Oscillospiraceae bacterium]|nr:radical SAM family heme chaperone HemW [Oscillospiraceae bacterium]